MGHFIDKCLRCKSVIKQCRCPGQKEVRWSVCDECGAVEER